MNDIPFKPGDTICDGKYEILELLGQGGMGVVYKARWVQLKRVVAIKMLTHIDHEMMLRLQREAEILAKINHSAVIEIYDIVQSSQWGPMLILEYVKGMDLTMVLQKPMAICEAIDLILAICSGISACHRYGIVHRDLKPSNIRLTEGRDWREKVKILDFGIAIPYNSPVFRANMARITQVGVITGTPCYTAPEIVRREEPTDRCDQYGIAMLLYMAITGREMYPDLHGTDLIQAILRGNFVSPRLYCPELPSELERILNRALHLSPSERFPSVVDFALALLPFAPSNTVQRWTLSFSKAKLPVARELLEPVSAARQQVSAPLLKWVEPIRGPARTPPTPPRVMSPTVVDPEPFVPPKPRSSHRRVSRKADRVVREQRVETWKEGLGSMIGFSPQTMWAFVAGSIFGAIIAVTVMILSFSFGSRSIKSEPPSTPPAASVSR